MKWIWTDGATYKRNWERIYGRKDTEKETNYARDFTKFGMQ